MKIRFPEGDIIVAPEKAWDIVGDNMPMLEGGGVLKAAEDEETNVKIYISLSSDLMVDITVFQDGNSVYSTEAFGADDLSEVLQSVYEDYLPVEDDVDDDEDDDNKELPLKSAEEVAISEREGELKIAAEDFLEIALCNSVGGFVNMKELDDEEVDEMLNHFMEYLARRFHLVGLYRPMYLYDEEKKEVFYSEEPYRHMVYDDEGKSS